MFGKVTYDEYGRPVESVLNLLRPQAMKTVNEVMNAIHKNKRKRYVLTFKKYSSDVVQHEFFNAFEAEHCIMVNHILTDLGFITEYTQFPDRDMLVVTKRKK